MRIAVGDIVVVGTVIGVVALDRVVVVLVDLRLGRGGRDWESRLIASSGKKGANWETIYLNANTRSVRRHDKVSLKGYPRLRR